MKLDHYFSISFIFFHYFFSFSNFGHFWAIFWPPPDPWGTQNFWLWSWIYPRSPWDVSQLQKTASWQLFTKSIGQKSWYGHFHYFGTFWGPLAACFSILSSLRIWIFLQFLYSGFSDKAGKTHSSVERRRDGLKQNPFIFEMAFMRCIPRKKGKALGQSRKLKKFV